MNSDLRTKGNIPLALGMNPTPKPNTTKICPTPFDPKTIDMLRLEFRLGFKWDVDMLYVEVAKKTRE